MTKATLPLVTWPVNVQWHQFRKQAHCSSMSLTCWCGWIDEQQCLPNSLYTGQITGCSATTAHQLSPREDWSGPNNAQRLPTQADRQGISIISVWQHFSIAEFTLRTMQLCTAHDRQPVWHPGVTCSHVSSFRGVLYQPSKCSTLIKQ